MPSSESFQNDLLSWHAAIERDMPWKNSGNAYHIWVSEIILQQTRVAQGTPYYRRFIDRFPSIQALARAKEDDVLKIWQGLGYYSRARNMHASAKTIVSQFGGKFPDNYEDILSLKGIGPYTAAAIASFAFNLPHAVVDGNVKRVIARYFLIEKDINKPTVQKEIQALVDKMIVKVNPASFNQAIMDFGALQCVPKKPDCLQCSLNNNCQALKKNKVSSLPLNLKKIKKRNRYFHYLVIQTENAVHIERRTGGDIWEGLYQFKLIETQLDQTLETEELQKMINYNIEPIDISKHYTHKLSHQDLIIKFYQLKIENNSKNLSSFNLVYKGNLKNFAFPKIIDRYLEEKSIYL
jgi:A/G-specific adenine glycosylase